MSAGCYLCEIKLGFVPGHSPGDAVGSCKLCGVFACLAHAYRNGGKPGYLCGCCVVNLLTVAATKKPPGGGAPPQPRGPKDPPQSDPSAPSGFAAWAEEVEEVADVIPDFAGKRWSSIRERTDYLTGYLGRPDGSAVRNLLADGEKARILMAAAIAIATEMRLPMEEMIPTLQQAMAAVLRYV